MFFDTFPIHTPTDITLCDVKLSTGHDLSDAPLWANTNTPAIKSRHISNFLSTPIDLPIITVPKTKHSRVALASFLDTTKNDATGEDIAMLSSGDKKTKRACVLCDRDGNRIQVGHEQEVLGSAYLNHTLESKTHEEFSTDALPDARGLMHGGWWAWLLAGLAIGGTIGISTIVGIYVSRRRKAGKALKSGAKSASSNGKDSTGDTNNNESSPDIKNAADQA